MRLYSSPDSVSRGEVSVLAVLETLVATFISLWIAWRIGTIKHLVIASALLPMLLLSSPPMVMTAHSMFKKWNGYVANRSAWTRIWAIPLIKVLAVMHETMRHPIETIAGIPKNFARNVLSIDSRYSLQLFPGLEEFGIPDNGGIFAIYSGMWKNVSKQSDVMTTIATIIGTMAASILMLPGFLPSIAYRWAMKSAGLFWLPLIWIITQSRSLDVFTRLTVITRSNWGRVTIAYSIVVLVVFLIKLALLFGYWRLPDLLHFGAAGMAAKELIDPINLPLWQVASAVNGVLAIAFFFHADIHILARGTVQCWSERSIQYEYATVTAIRGIIMLYCLACTFYIVTSVAWNTEWPAIHFILFPWAK